MEIVLLIYALMKNVPISLPSVMNFTMNSDPTKWAQEANWREEDEEVAHPIPPPMPSLVPLPAAPTDIPAPAAPSSLEPSRRDLMRALRRNERIMHRHEQPMLMLHPGLDTSGLEQISSPEISQAQQEQGARSAGRAYAEEEEDFQSAEATAGASTNEGGESTDDD
ncbi:hypothetical protein PIB30_061045 [Stylosanthes scabra]|uniref:Uncharacterized protein n=1 Tax=Stylosanthes scabra TaxID=79078 RepID=A0ABU6SLW7_9FABA|nr:hypothetical protein [Stylosanthes scabra]